MSTSKEWYQLSEIDYYSSFIKLWLSFNAFYKDMYQDNTLLTNDRKYIEELKTTENRIKRKFVRFFESSDSNDASEFKYFLQIFMRHYGGDIIGSNKIEKDTEKNIKPQMGGIVQDEISFQDFIHPRNFQLTKNSISGYKKIERLYIKDDANLLWPTYLEILYMSRNLLVHGVMEPSEDNHELIKSAYITLRYLMRDYV